MAQRPGFPSLTHDHRACRQRGLRAAEAVCRAKGVKLTALRRRVLDLILESHQPVGAYALLGRLAKDGRRPAPPTIYRALEFLMAQGLVHRVESRNAYVGCARPTHAQGGAILICRACGMAAETEDGALSTLLARNAARLGFALERSTVEIEGLCPACQDGRPL